MPQTPVSATTPYITAADLVTYRDWRQMGDWLSTNDTRPANQAAFEALPTVQEHCNAAGGLLEAAVLKGHRYEVADLQALQTQAGQSWSLCKRLLCFIAIDSMSRFKRRTAADETDIQWALDLLDEIGKGERIFSFQETQDAGLPETTPLSHHHQRPSIQAAPLFGARGRRWWWWW